MLNIRAMQPLDIDNVYRIELSAHRAPWSRDILRDCVLVGYDCRVLEQGDEKEEKRILGYIICRHSFNICHILNLCIAPSYQHQGFGKFILKALLNSLRDSAINTIILEVRPSNLPAIALYKAFGFKKDAIKEGYYKDVHGEEDALLLKKLL